MRSLVICLFLLAVLSAFGQNEEKFACDKRAKDNVRDYFQDLQKNNLKLAEIYRNFNLPSGKVRLPFCWHSCAINLVKPTYPSFAGENKIIGTVEVEAIADESGKVFFAKTIKGNLVFHRNAEKAACHSRFKPILFNGKSVKFRWKIVYKFVI
jgi:hypothetical protein